MTTLKEAYRIAEEMCTELQFNRSVPTDNVINALEEIKTILQKYYLISTAVSGPESEELVIWPNSYARDKVPTL